jgi:hypothetical protein
VPSPQPVEEPPWLDPFLWSRTMGPLLPPAKATLLAAIKIVIAETGTTIKSLRMMTLHLLRLY